MAKSFGEAFASARKMGKKEFTWNGKRYHTRTKEEENKKSPPTPSPRPDREKDVPRPTPRPNREKKDAPTPSPRPTRLPKLSTAGKKDQPKRKSSARKDAASSVDPSKMHERFSRDRDSLSIKNRKKSKGGSSKLSILDRIKGIFN